MDKTKKKSKSMEEIFAVSYNNNSKDNLARTNEIRQSLPTHHLPNKKKIIHPTLDDRIDEEDDNPVVIEMGRDADRDVRGSQLSKKSQRSNRSKAGSSSSRTREDSLGSKASRASRNKSASYDNRAFDTTLDRISVTSRASRAPSVQSLEVQREQYCCFSKWSPFERKLAALIGVLSTVIIILIVAVILLAKGNS